jgi:hypothetical protein
MGCAVTLPHNCAIGRLCRQKLLQQHCYSVIKKSVNRARTTFGLVSWKFIGLCGKMKPKSHYWLPFLAKTVATTSLLCPKNERQWSVNNVCLCIADNPRVVRRNQNIIALSAIFLGENAFDNIVTML